MIPVPVDEPPIDVSFEYYMEERALAIALAMAESSEQQAKVERLADLRADLMQRRHAYMIGATAKGHARGEIYSKARAGAVNALAPCREELDASVKSLYMAQGTSEDVLRVHARAHFTSVLVSKRLSLALMPSDIAESAREMHAHEESFARAWIDAVGDPSFLDEMRVLQSEAAKQPESPRRTASLRFRP